MIPIVWRWEERDFGFRFRGGQGRRASEYYQGANPGEYYIVPSRQRKLERARIEQLCRIYSEPAAPHVIANPWLNYEREEWDWIETDDGICINYAGCLDWEEIYRREDEGVQRTMEYIEELVERPEPVPLTIDLIRRMHIALMGDIYPFAGDWRNVDLHRGDGPTRWPLPPDGIRPLMDVFERDVLSRSPFVSDEDEEVFYYTSEVINELIAIHPFREGNGRTALMLGNLILMQNDLLPLNVYNRRVDEVRYFEACEAGRIHRDYSVLAGLLEEWQDRALERWETDHG